MTIRVLLLSTFISIALLSTAGCEGKREKETLGGYVDDTSITTRIKARFFEDKQVAGSAIHVETLNGTVILSGFAKSELEKTTAETIARDNGGVKAVKNEITIKP